MREQRRLTKMATKSTNKSSAARTWSLLPCQAAMSALRRLAAGALTQHTRPSDVNAEHSITMSEQVPAYLVRLLDDDLQGWSP